MAESSSSGISEFFLILSEPIYKRDPCYPAQDLQYRIGYIYIEGGQGFDATIGAWNSSVRVDSLVLTHK